jgi:hypothetical protein
MSHQGSFKDESGFNKVPTIRLGELRDGNTICLNIETIPYVYFVQMFIYNVPSLRSFERGCLLRRNKEEYFKESRVILFLRHACRAWCSKPLICCCQGSQAHAKPMHTHAYSCCSQSESRAVMRNWRTRRPRMVQCGPFCCRTDVLAVLVVHFFR